jgi:transcriptional regulator with XRE-family HTH domain
MTVFNDFKDRMNMAALAERLKEFRERRKLSQVRLAELINVSPRVYNRWENGDATPHWNSIVKIADFLGASLDELAGRTEINDNIVIHNHKLHELYKKVDLLPDKDQEALIILLDSLMARTDLNTLMKESETIRN